MRLVKGTTSIPLREVRGEVRGEGRGSSYRAWKRKGAPSCSVTARSHLPAFALSNSPSGPASLSNLGHASLYLLSQSSLSRASTPALPLRGDPVLSWRDRLLVLPRPCTAPGPGLPAQRLCSWLSASHRPWAGGPDAFALLPTCHTSMLCAIC